MASTLKFSSKMAMERPNDPVKRDDASASETRSEAAPYAASLPTFNMGDTIMIRQPGNRAVPASAFTIPHPATLNMANPHDLGSSLVNPPPTAFDDDQGVRAHVGRLMTHLKEYAGRVRVEVAGKEGEFLALVRDRF